MVSLDELMRRIEDGSAPADHGNRHKRLLWTDLLAQAERTAPGLPDWKVLRVPGRVNLIGEHTDYNGLPVMPLAIDREIVAAFRPIDAPRVRVFSIGKSLNLREFELSRDIEPYAAGDWGNYPKGCVQSLVRWASDHGLPLESGCEMVIHGDLRSAGGLSSSSALVVAAGLAFASVNALILPRAQMAELMAEGERYVGTQGGAMDHTVCLMAQRGAALRIDFNPIRATPVAFPEGYVVVVANSLVRAEKSAKARARFNMRATECRIAAALVAKAAGAETNQLSDVFSAAPDSPLDALETAVKHSGYSITEIAESLEMPPPESASRFLLQSDGGYLAQPEEGFQPYRRARHVLTEAQRVDQAAEALATGDMTRLGELMSASHQSCRDDFEISCPEVEALVSISRAAGALGSRITGAGFGGCVVALAPRPSSDAIMQAIQEHYYGGYLKEHRPDLLTGQVAWRAQRSYYLFACVPQQGAEVFE